METLEKKSKAIKNIGNAITALSAMIIFGNGMGIFSFTILGFGNIDNGQATGNTSALGWIFEHYLSVCLSMIFIGVIYLLGGVFVAKYKLWANRLVTFVSGLLFVIIWSLMIFMFIAMSGQVELQTFRIGSIATALFWSTPLVILIWYLNKKNTLKHFV